MSENRGIPLPVESALFEHRVWLYRDDARPSWAQDPGGNPQKTSVQAEHEQDLLIKALNRSHNPLALALSRSLEGCSRFNPCLSGACPTCMRAAQRLFVHAARNLCDENDRDMLAVTVVWAGAAIEYGRLSEPNVFQPTNLHLLQALSAIHVPAIGGFDISANEHESGDFAPHWMPHAYIFAPREPLSANESAFRAAFPRSELASRPVRVDTFDGKPTAFAYALKPDFVRRVTLVPKTREDGSRSRFGTRTKQLPEPQRVELALALDRAGLDARFFLCGYDLITSNRDVEFMRTPSAPQRPGVEGQSLSAHRAIRVDAKRSNARHHL